MYALQKQKTCSTDSFCAGSIRHHKLSKFESQTTAFPKLAKVRVSRSNISLEATPTLAFQKCQQVSDGVSKDKSH